MLKFELMSSMINEINKITRFRSNKRLDLVIIYVKYV